MVARSIEIAREPWGTVRIVDVPTEIPIGEEFRLRVAFDLNPGALVQVGDEIGFEVLAPEHVRAAEIRVPDPELLTNEGFGELWVRSTSFEAELPLRVLPSARGQRELVLDGRLRMRGADGRQVFLPVTRRFEVPLRLRVEAEEVSTLPPPPETPSGPHWLPISALVLAGLGAAWFVGRRRSE